MRFLFLLTTLVLMAFSTGCVRDNAISDAFGPGQDKVAQAPTATVADFVESYGENSVKANKEYKNKWVKVRGRVVAINKREWFDGRTFYQVELVDENGKYSKVLNCRFNFNRESEVMTLKTGQVAVLYGLIDEAIEFGAMPTVSDCKLVSAATAAK